jgi:hypothetical protein
MMWVLVFALLAVLVVREGMNAHERRKLEELLCSKSLAEYRSPLSKETVRVRSPLENAKRD